MSFLFAVLGAILWSYSAGRFRLLIHSGLRDSLWGVAVRSSRVICLGSTSFYCLRQFVFHSLPLGLEKPSIITAASGILWLISKRGKQKSELESYQSSLWQGFLEFSGVLFGVAILFYCVQLFVYSTFPADLTSMSVKMLEDMLLHLNNSLVPFLKLPKVADLLILVVLVLTGASIPLVAKLRLIRRFKAYSIWTHRICLALTFLTSVTFFGSGTRGVILAEEARLKEQVDKVRSSYLSYIAELQNKMTEIVVKQEITIAGSTAAGLGSQFDDLQRAITEQKLQEEEARPGMDHQALESVSVNLPRPDSPLGDLNPFFLQSETTALPYNEVSLGSASERSLDGLNSDLRSRQTPSLDPDASLVTLVQKIATTSSGQAVDALLNHSGLNVAGPLVKALLEPLLYGPLKEVVKRNTKMVVESSFLNKLDISVLLRSAQSSIALQVNQALTTESVAKIRDASRKWHQEITSTRELLSRNLLVLRKAQKRVDERISREMATAEDGPWGSYRKSLREAIERDKLNTDDATTKARIERVFAKWRASERSTAITLLEKKQHYSPEEWERSFADLTKITPDLAVLWGWVVKSERSQVIAKEYKTSNPVPQMGYALYLEETGYGSAILADSVFREPQAAEFLGDVCDRLGKSAKE